MHTKILSLLIFLGNLTPLWAQEHYVWLRLTENRVVTNSKLDSVGVETLTLNRSVRPMTLPLDEILQIRITSARSMGNGALLGGGIGLAAGAFTGVLVKAFGGSESSPATAMVVFTVIGGIVGGTIAALEQPGDIVDLSGLDRAAKRARIEELVSNMEKSTRD